MNLYTRIVARGLRLTMVLALILSVVPLNVAVAHPAIDRVDAVHETRVYHSAVDQPPQSAPQAPDAVGIMATKRDTIVNDVDSDGRADPGDTLRYTVIITNSGDTDATGVVFNDAIDNNTVLSGTIKSTPLARDDAYTAVGNVRISVPTGSGVLANDNDPDGSAISVMASSTTSANGGNVTVNADGSFTYNPPSGFTGTDTFTYTIQDTDGNQNSATVTVTVGGMIWFVNSAAAGGGDGRLTAPFNCLTGAGCFSAVAAEDPGDSIFVYENATAYSNGITLLNNQKLIGQDATNTLAVLAGVTPPSYSEPLPAMNIGAPATTINGGTNAVTLAQNNALYGFTAGTAAGASINGSSFGTLLVNDVIINATGAGLSLSTGSFGATANFTSLTSSGGVNNVSLTSVNGTANLGSGALSGATGHAFVVDGGTGTLTYAGTINNTTARLVSISNKTGGSVTLSGAESGTAQGVVLGNNTGATINFSGGNLNLNTGVNTAFIATGGGTVNVTGSSNIISTTTGTAVNIANTTVGASGVTFRSISSNGGANPGIILNNTGVSGNFTVTGDGGGSSNGSGGVIQNKTGNAIELTSVRGVSLSYLNIDNADNNGILGSSVANFNMSRSNLTNIGDAATPDEAPLNFTNLSGTGSFQNNAISNAFDDQFMLTQNGSTVLTLFTISANTFTGHQGDNDAFRYQGYNTSNSTIDIRSNTFLNSDGDFIQTVLENTANLNLTVGGPNGSDGNTFNVTGFTPLAGGLTLSPGGGAGWNGRFDFDIRNNTISNANVQAINVNLLSSTSAVIDGFIRNNTISNSNNNFGGSIQVTNGGASSNVRVQISDNQISGDNGTAAIYVIGSQPSNNSPRTDLIVNNNTVTAPRAFNTNAFHLNSSVTSGVTGVVVCLDMANNNMNNVSTGGTDVRLRQRFDAQVLLPGYTGPANNSGAQVEAYIPARPNTITDISTGTQSPLPGGAGWFNGSCTAPTAQTPQAREVAAISQTELTLTSAGAGGNSKPLLSLPFNPASAPQVDRVVKIDRVEAPIAPFNIGTLPAGKTITLTFDVTINNPVPDGVTQVSNQGTVSGGNFTNVVTDDPDTPAPNDPTITPLDIQSDLALTKSDGGATATPGGTIAYTLNYTNTGPNSASGVVLTETIPANTAFYSAGSTPGWTCAGATCTFNVGVLGINASGMAVFAVTVVNPVSAGVTQISNSASIGTSVIDPVPGNNTASDATPVTAEPDLTLTKTDGGASVAPGGTIAYTLNYANAGNQGATGVALTETVPTNTTFNAGASSAGWTCTPNNNAGSICTLTVGSVNGGGASGTRTFAVTAVNPVAAGVTQISNTASVADDGTNGADPNPGDNTANDTTPVIATPDLSLTKTDGGATTTPSGTVAYTLNYANAGNQGATGVVLTETVPANTTFNAGASTAEWTCFPDNSAGSICTLTIGALSSGANGSATFAVTVDSSVPAGATQITNTANVADDGSNGADPTPGNNTASDTTPVTAAPDLQLSKSDGGARGIPGGTVAYTLFFTNTGNQGATGVTLTDTVPANSVFNSGASSADWSCANGAPPGTACSLAVGGVTGGGANGSRIFAVTVDDPFPLIESAITNTASIADDGTNDADVTPGNNVASDSTPIDNVPDLQITKTHTGNFTKGQIGATYTLHVSNVGGLPTSGTVTVTDALPTGLTATALSGTGWSCNVGSLACTRSDALNALTSYPDLTLTVDVAVNASSTVTNTATVSGGGESNTANDTANNVTSINKAASATALTSGPNPSVFGQSVTFTATVTSGVGTPTGVVTFTEGATTLGTGNLNASGIATISTSNLAVGGHNVTANYGGDANFNTSNGAATQTVNQANSATALTSAPNPSTFGQSTTFTATVTAAAPGAGTPTGVVTFTEGAAVLGTGTLSGGVASFSTASLAVGTHTVTATYSGDGNFNTSNGTHLHAVDRANSATTVTSAPNPSRFGQSVTFTATVTSPVGTPTGVVTFTEDATMLGTGTLNASGAATFTTALLAVGAHNVTASYGGDANFIGSNGSHTQNVIKSDTTTALASAPNPSVFGQAVMFTATVTVSLPGSGTPTGNVTFFDGSVSLGAGTLNNGVATFATTTLSVGSHVITATYSGDASFNGNISSPTTQTVSQANTATSLTSAPNASVFGQSVTFTATVTASAPGAGTPTGLVTFVDGTTVLGTGALSGNMATFSTSSLSVGAHSISANYGGDTNFIASTSITMTQTVNKADSATAITPSQNPSVFGQNVTFTTTVTAVAPGIGTPTGVVTFTVGAVTQASTLTGGVATFGSAALPVGAHNVTVSYSGDGNFSASISTPMTQTVNKANTTAAIISHTPNPAFVGDAVTVTFTVTTNAPGAGTPTGMITVTDGVVSCNATLPATGCTLVFATPGIKNLTATYGGDGSFNGSMSAAVTHTIEDIAINGLSAANSSPHFVGRTTFLTATIAAGTNVVYQWNYGDGQTGNGALTNHLYPAAGTYTAIVTASNAANVVTATTAVIIKQTKIYMPIVMRQYVAAPDLVVKRIIASPNNVQIVIQNIGDRPVLNEFWVDVYISPTVAPSHVNQTWPMFGTQGLVWGVTNTAFSKLQAGGVLTLTMTDDYFISDLSHVTWPLAIGTPIYAQVDSADASTTYGAVFENHEISGAPYNNIMGPVLVTNVLSRLLAQPLHPTQRLPFGLPLRP